MKITNDVNTLNFRMAPQWTKIVAKKESILYAKNPVIDTFQKNFNSTVAIQGLKVLLRNKLEQLEAMTPQSIDWAVKHINEDNYELAQTLLDNEEFPKDKIGGILSYTKKENLNLAKKLCTDKNFPKDKIFNILWRANPDNIDFAEKLCFSSNIDKKLIDSIICHTKKENLDLAKKLCFENNFPQNEIANILCYAKKENIELAKKMCTDKDFPKNLISKILIKTNHENLNYTKELCQKYKELNIPPDKIEFLIENQGRVTPQQLVTLIQKAGKDKVDSFSSKDLLMACKMHCIYEKTDLSQLSAKDKKAFLQQMLACSKGAFNISSTIEKNFPLLPTNEEMYNEILTELSVSKNIQINPLLKHDIERFEQLLNGLSSTLINLSDKDFAKLKVSQEYSKDKFIENILKITKELTPDETQNIYDLLGFELYENKKSPVGYSILNYPQLGNKDVNNNFLNSSSKEAYDKIQKEISKFLYNNPIKSNNPDIEFFINETVKLLPEIRTQIQKLQHETHDFDIMLHSLKVMQKIVQNEDFYSLSGSDKKIMLIASLLHDIAKQECEIDKSHPHEGGYDAYLISKKFNLTEDEEYKLFTLIKHHDWLEYVNKSKSPEQLDYRLQSVAYDFRFDNLIDMAKIFTHADLKAVKIDNSFHDSKKDFIDKTQKSFGEACDIFAEQIKYYIDELQKTQPFLPVTNFPKASTIRKAIKYVNSDGSTNIKGVYEDKDGLIVIKYNEVEDWEKIGFPKGSISRGIQAKGRNSKNKEIDVNTGNIKFFIHALERENQLKKLKILSSIDSEAMLSNTYAERPESKYRFFRPQGVILDYATINIHCGGKSDSGSGYAKTISNVKKEYLFGKYREKDRKFISNMIKNFVKLNDNEYIELIKQYHNKSFTDIEPQEFSEEIIKALAMIKSNTRDKNREYNEVCASNIRRIMAVFAYNIDPNEKINNPINFLNRRTISNAEMNYKGIGSQPVYWRTKFLREYALENDIPFVIFGD